ncbi:MAG TPA: cyclic nucleotide-binding domain-containing protein, partial [Phnomibacter sp.]|nr:cyclic nucleotide-binding domain-containing protein [Phnomibacter sp.]
MERLVILAAMEQYCKKVLPEMQPQEWEAFQSGLTIHSYAKGEHILREGEICRQVFYLFKGLIRFYYVQDGKEIITGFIDDNQFAADYTSFLQQTPSKKNIEALQPTWLAALPYTHMQHVYQQYPVFQI